MTPDEAKATVEDALKWRALTSVNSSDFVLQLAAVSLLRWRGALKEGASEETAMKEIVEVILTCARERYCD